MENKIKILLNENKLLKNKDTIEGKKLDNDLLFNNKNNINDLVENNNILEQKNKFLINEINIINNIINEMKNKIETLQNDNKLLNNNKNIDNNHLNINFIKQKENNLLLNKEINKLKIQIN